MSLPAQRGRSELDAHAQGMIDTTCNRCSVPMQTNATAPMRLCKECHALLLARFWAAWDKTHK